MYRTYNPGSCCDIAVPLTRGATTFTFIAIACHNSDHLLYRNHVRFDMRNLAGRLCELAARLSVCVPCLVRALHTAVCHTCSVVVYKHILIDCCAFALLLLLLVDRMMGALRSRLPPS